METEATCINIWGMSSSKSHSFRRLSIAAVLLGAALMVSGGCSKYLYKIVYNRVDSLALNRVDKYFDLRGDQKDFLSVKLKSHHRWHRRSQLPAYIGFAREITGRGQDGLSSAELDWAYKKFNSFANRLYARTLSDGAAFLATVDAEQIAYLEKQLKESNEDLIKTVKKSRAKRLSERADRTVKYMEDWFGDLDADQERKVRAMSRRMPDSAANRLKYRRERQKEFIALLRAKPGKKVIEKKLRDWLVYRTRNYPSYYRRDALAWRQRSRAMILEVDKMITPEQRKYFIARVDELAKDFSSL